MSDHRCEDSLRLEWLLDRIEESRVAYNKVVEHHPDAAVLKELRWPVGHMVVTAEMVQMEDMLPGIEATLAYKAEHPNETGEPRG